MTIPHHPLPWTPQVQDAGQVHLYTGPRNGNVSALSFEHVSNTCQNSNWLKHPEEISHWFWRCPETRWSEA